MTELLLAWTCLMLTVTLIVEVVMWRDRRRRWELPLPAERRADHVCSGEGNDDCPNALAHWTEDELVSGIAIR